MKSRLRTLLKMIFAVAAVYLLFVGIIVGFQNRLLFVPSAASYDSLLAMGAEGEDIWLTTEDGINLHGWFMQNKESDYVILFSHGNAGNIGMRTELAGLLFDSGASVFMYDYRGYGLSDGAPREEGLYKDVRAAVTYLTEVRKVPPEKIILYGRSLGGAVAAYAATEFNVAGLVLDSAFIDLRSVVKDIYPFIPPVLAFSEFHTGHYLNSREQMPLMIFHSPDDRLIRFHHGETLYENTHGPKRFVELQGGHNNNFRLTEELFVESWKSFLKDIRMNEEQGKRETAGVRESDLQDF